MGESILEWIKFWLGCIHDGFEFGDYLFGISEFLLLIIIGYSTYRKLHHHAEKWEEASVKWMWIILGFSFVISTIFVAPFLKYSDAEDARKKTQAALDDKSPKLEGFVHRLVAFDEAGTTDSTIFLDVSISNLGETPSDAEEYGLNVILSTNVSITGEELKFTNEYTSNFFYKDQPWLLDLKRPQLIAEKTISSIQNGGHERGWLAYRLHGLKIGQYKQTNVVFLIYKY